MADLAAVADTHALVFHATGHARLGARARAHFAATEARAAITYVPAAVLWECSFLLRIGRVTLRTSLSTFVDELFRNPAFHPVDIGVAHVLAAADLTFARDPFDALIVATARFLDVPLITRDAAIEGAKVVKVVW